MLRSLTLRDVVIVRELELDFAAGFSVLTGETGAGKSILIDALQLALGGRGDAVVVREGAARADIAATFDTPQSLKPWLDDAGFVQAEDPNTLLVRRSIDAQGRSRAWINGISATVTQLREAADHLVDIHGQHAWQSLTRPAAVRAWLDEYADADTAALGAAWTAWQQALQALQLAASQAGERERERERLAWQVAEVDKLAPAADEWPELNQEHQRLSHAQALIDAAQKAADAVTDADDNAQALVARAANALDDVVNVDARLQPVLDVLRSAQLQLDDAAHTLHAYLQHADLDPQRLAKLDERLSSWMSLARRFRTPSADLAALHASWKADLQSMDAAGDTEALTQAAATAERTYRDEGKRVSKARHKAGPELGNAVTAAMQTLGMAGGRFQVALDVLPQPQSFGLESVEFLVAGHAGSAPRAIGKVASGGELSRLALAIAVTASQRKHLAFEGADTLIFDEIDAGIGGTVADTVGQLMQQLGRERQVLAVTHLAQVAASANHHYVVSKSPGPDGKTASAVAALKPEQRVTEMARMLGGAKLSTSVAHAQELLDRARPRSNTAPGTGGSTSRRTPPASQGKPVKPTPTAQRKRA